MSGVGGGRWELWGEVLEMQGGNDFGGFNSHFFHDEVATKPIWPEIIWANEFFLKHYFHFKKSITLFYNACHTFCGGLVRKSLFN